MRVRGELRDLILKRWPPMTSTGSSMRPSTARRRRSRSPPRAAIASDVDLYPAFLPIVVPAGLNAEGLPIGVENHGAALAGKACC